MSESESDMTAMTRASKKRERSCNEKPDFDEDEDNSEMVGVQASGPGVDSGVDFGCHFDFDFQFWGSQKLQRVLKSFKELSKVSTHCQKEKVSLNDFLQHFEKSKRITYPFEFLQNSSYGRKVTEQGR